VTVRLYSLCVVCAVVALALFTMGAAAPRLKPATGVAVAVACPETGDCWVKATWKLHPTYAPATDSVRLVWKEGTANLATHYTDLTSDSIAVTRAAAARSGTVTATVWRTGVSQQSPAVSAPWTVPAIVAPPEPVDSLKTQVGLEVSPASVSLAVAGVRQFCAYALYSDGSREVVSGTGCS
jgi:hypothetical protein